MRFVPLEPTNTSLILQRASLPILWVGGCICLCEGMYYGCVCRYQLGLSYAAITSNFKSHWPKPKKDFFFVADTIYQLFCCLYYLFILFILPTWDSVPYCLHFVIPNKGTVPYMRHYIVCGRGKRKKAKPYDDFIVFTQIWQYHFHPCLIGQSESPDQVDINLHRKVIFWMMIYVPHHR